MANAVSKQPPTVFDTGYYRIEFQGNLSESWKEVVDGMHYQVRFDDSGSAVTELRGEIVDHAALFGLLSLIYDLGMPLLFVERVADA